MVEFRLRSRNFGELFQHILVIILSCSINDGEIVDFCSGCGRLRRAGSGAAYRRGVCRDFSVGHVGESVVECSRGQFAMNLLPAHAAGGKY